MRNYLFLLCYLGAVTLYGQTPVKIVCMGNSITNGKVKGSKINELSYRPWLWEMLDSAGYLSDFVGYTDLWYKEDPKNRVTPPKSRFSEKTFDRSHDSYYGIKSEGLLKGNNGKQWTGAPIPKLSKRLEKYTPDVALLHIGTNDKDKDLKKTVKNINLIIDELRKRNPAVKVIVAKLITGWKPINKEVDAIVKNKTTAQSPVYSVDMATGFVNDTINKLTSMTFDWVHPNERGQKLMAERWFNALQQHVFSISSIPKEALKSTKD